MGFRSWCMLASFAGLLSAAAQAQVPVDLRGYYSIDKLPKRYKRLPLPRFAKSVVIVPNREQFELAEVSPNEGITFQRGEMNPKLNYRVPFCTLKFARNPETWIHYHGFEDIVRLTAASPIVSGAVVTIDGRLTSGNLTTMIYVNVPGQPQVSDVVELVQCMVAKNSETLYREPSAAELVPIFGPWAKMYVQPKK